MAIASIVLSLPTLSTPGVMGRTEGPQLDWGLSNTIRSPFRHNEVVTSEKRRHWVGSPNVTGRRDGTG